MSGYLLDTNIALIALVEPQRLSRKVTLALHDGPNHLSVVSYWEVVIKASKGLLNVRSPRTWWESALEQLSASSLKLSPAHISNLITLEPLHKDPFDRVLVAQARAESLTLLTTDAHLKLYAARELKIIT